MPRVTQEAEELRLRPGSLSAELLSAALPGVAWGLRNQALEWRPRVPWQSWSVTFHRTREKGKESV